jgi:alpha-D-ribose 1-methylphosphonate 5-triphosphate synthase subunit PhnH
MIDAKDLQSPAQAAHSFRAILDAFSEPGVPIQLSAVANCPAPLQAASAVLALSLCDFQTPVWLSKKLDGPDVRSFLRFHTGASIVGKAEDAAYAFLDASEFADSYPRLHKGTDEYPDRSATAVVQVSNFFGLQSVRLEGPGIKTAVELSIAGFAEGDWTMLSDDRILFPLGVDVAFASGAQLVAVPRSTRISLMEGR